MGRIVSRHFETKTLLYGVNKTLTVLCYSHVSAIVLVLDKSSDVASLSVNAKYLCFKSALTLGLNQINKYEKTYLATSLRLTS